MLLFHGAGIIFTHVYSLQLGIPGYVNGYLLCTGRESQHLLSWSGAAKKTPERNISIRGFPFLSSKSYKALSVREGYAVYPGRSSDFRIILQTVPSHPALTRQWYYAVFVPDYSGGPVLEFHEVPYYAQV